MPEFTDTLAEHTAAVTLRDDEIADQLKIKYQGHRSTAKTRGIPFLLTFDEWLGLWEQSGHLQERGIRTEQYVMARFGDEGPYAIGNVKIITTGENAREIVQTPALRKQKTAHMIGKPSKNRKLTDEQVLEIRTTYKFRSKTHNTTAFAAKYGVHFVTIWEALKGRGWKTV